MSIKRSIITIGVFDGVHIGHRTVISKVLKRANVKRAKSVVVTFDPHPMKALKSGQEVPSLISLKHRIGLLKKLGVDKVMVLKFDHKMAVMKPERFIKDILIGRADAGEIFVGEDFRFGRNARAGIAGLKHLGEKEGLKVHVVKHIKKNGRIVSSSLIRQAVSLGRTREASMLLGRPYSILGTVVSGSRLGRRLGYPTANVNPHHEAIPPSGVYAVKIRYAGRLYGGVLNIGVRPTFYNYGKDREPSIEVHIFGFRKRIYGRDLEIIFIKRLRGEKRFKRVDSLVKQIKSDTNRARKVV